MQTEEIEQWLASIDMKTRRAVLLLAGMKSNKTNWYQHMVPRADALMDKYLEERK
ncbi:MAG: hypothetical protein F2545_07490 [Actinobacteria bacterium]|nr:hypothetical protein [Actinomycetota bacterium]